MNHFSFELSLIAALPALFLCGYVFYKDRIEKEPVGLLAALFAIGAAAYIPACWLQRQVIAVLDRAFASSITAAPDGFLAYTSAGAEFAHKALCALLGFSMVQVCIKWLLMYVVTRKNKHFNYLFDGIVYATFLSLGFALAENIHFVLQGNLDLLTPKLLTSVPGHLFIGILMGYYYTMWHARFTANAIENHMLKSGMVKEDKVRTSAPWLAASLLVPCAVNAVYVFAGSSQHQTAVMLFYTVVFMLYGFSFIAIDRMAARDSSSARYLCRIIAKGHPELDADIIEAVVRHDLHTEQEGNK